MTNSSCLNTSKLSNKFVTVILSFLLPSYDIHQVGFERREGSRSYLDLLKGGNPRRVFLGCALQMWSQLSGMNVMM